MVLNCPWIELSQVFKLWKIDKEKRPALFSNLVIEIVSQINHKKVNGREKETLHANRILGNVVAKRKNRLEVTWRIFGSMAAFMNFFRNVSQVDTN